MSVDVQYETHHSNCPPPSKIQEWVITTLKKVKKSGDVSILIVDEEKMHALNLQYRKKDKPTNVLSFPCRLPIPLRGELLGDIVICAPIVEKEGNHWAHMVIHGVLHLLGYDHENESDALIMEKCENELLAELDYQDNR